MYSPLYFIKLHNTRTHAHTHGMRFIISRLAGRREIKMARHIVCVLDRTVGHVSICWDYVSTFLCNKKALLKSAMWVTLALRG